MKLTVTKEPKGHSLVFWPERNTEGLVSKMLKTTFERMGCLTESYKENPSGKHGVKIYLSNIQILQE